MPQEELSAFWDELSPETKNRGEDPSDATHAVAKLEPGKLHIGTSQRVLISICPDGTLEYGEGYTPDEAAVIFWEEMGRRRLETEERLLLFQHLEAILVRLGTADIRNEETQRRMGETPTQENARASARTHAILERAMHQAIELGRGLARRPGVPAPVIPERIPAQIAENDASSYAPEFLEIDRVRRIEPPTDEG